MKHTTIMSLLLVATFLILSCNNNKKLFQENATKAIKEFIATKEAPSGHFNNGEIVKGKFNQDSASIDAVSQFSETEASAIAHLLFSNPPFANNRTLTIDVKFIFKKNVDNKWILASVENINEKASWIVDWFRKSDNNNLSIIAQ